MGRVGAPIGCQREWANEESDDVNKHLALTILDLDLRKTHRRGHCNQAIVSSKTSQLTAHKFGNFDIPFEDGIVLTSLKGMLETGNAGPTMVVMGDLDSLKVLDHPPRKLYIVGQNFS